MKILVNDEIVDFNHDDFPMLISGACKTGSSLFSVSLVSNLFENGNKVVFMTAYPEAKVEFRNQLGNLLNDNAIIIDSGEESVLLEKLDQIEDLNERIVLLKNMENYSIKLFDKLKDLKLVIFYGDIDKCEFGEQLAEKEFKTKIFFSYPEKIFVENKIELLKYKGLIISDKYNGIASI